MLSDACPVLEDIWPSSDWWNHGFLPWLEPVATALAFVAAAVAAIYAARIYRRETAREHRIEDAQKRAQASLVSAWIGVHRVPKDDRPVAGVLPMEVTYRPALFLRNASELPVFAVEARILVDGDDVSEAAHGFDVLAPSDEPASYTIDSFMPKGWDGSGRVSLKFVDSSGRTWRRLADGRLLDPDEDGVGWAGISLA